VRPDAMP